MGSRFLNPFLTAAKEVFDTMIDIPLVLGKPKVRNGEEFCYNMSGIVEISGEINGIAVINLSEQTALKFTSALLGEEIKKIDETCTDAVGEIANMIAGNAKRQFPVFNTCLSVPTVLTSKHEVKYPSVGSIVSIPCETDEGRFSIELAFEAFA
jgi:chemotaxis protein CheX